MVRGIRRLPIAAAMAVVALSAPVASAQDRQPTAQGTGGAAASVDPLATNAAIAVLSRGGNAIDAAVAAASVLGVVEPYSCGLGGGGFMTIRDGRTGRITTFDSRETAPQAMKPDSFFIDGQPPTDAQFPINRYSGLSVGVPGTPALWEKVLRRYGTYSLGKALAYGAKVARDGFTVDQTFFDQTTPNAPYFDDVPSTAALYLDADGTPRDVGTTIKNPDLAKTYELLGRFGTQRAFYRGPLAKAIVSAAQNAPLAPTADHTWRPGLITQQDLERYRVIERKPVHINYRGVDIWGMAPPSSGGTTALEALNLLQYGKQPADKTETLYRYLEASRLAYADRNAYLGDPAFVANPLRGLLDPHYAAQRAALIPPTSANNVVGPGLPQPGNAASVDRVGSTTHLSVADRYGNVVAYTFTIEQTGGNGVVVPGYGFLLNNELTDFDTASTTAPNRADGGKRPRSSIAPTIVTRHGQPLFTVGSPGGASIIATVLQILVDRLDLGMTLPEAIAAPRASQRNSTTTEAESAFVNSPEGQALASAYNEAYRAPAGDEIGAATGIEFVSGGTSPKPGHGHPHRGHGGTGGADRGHGGANPGHGGTKHGHGGADRGHGGADHGPGGADRGHGGRAHAATHRRGSHGRPGTSPTFLAAAEPVRRGGGSAAVVTPSR